MLYQKEYFKLKKILHKISRGDSVTINERLFLEDHASRNSEVFQLLGKAQCSRRLADTNSEELTSFMGSLGLNGTFDNEHYNPNIETIDQWFTNAPNWLRRS